MLSKLSLFTVASVLSFTFSFQTALADPTFSNITSEDFDKITEDMSANFTHSSILGASKMGTVFGFQVGLVAAQTSTPRTNEIVQRNAGAELKSLYNAGLMAAVGIPMGIAFEAVMFPEVKSSGGQLSSTSLAIKYNINEVIPILPINVALRGVYTNSKFSFDQTVASVTSSVSNKNSVTGLQLLISPMLPMVEPYVGVGLLNGSNELSVSGTTSVFDAAFSTAQTESRSKSTTQILAGVDVSLLLIKFGVEYSQAFGTSRYAAKLAFGF